MTHLRMGAEMNIILSYLTEESRPLAKRNEAEGGLSWWESPVQLERLQAPLEDSDQGMIGREQETCRCSEEFGCFVRSAYFFQCLARSRIVLHSPGVPCSSCCLHLER